MSMLGMRDGERGSYPELVDALASHGADAKADARQLYRRVAFSVLVSNVDDHLRNHGFLWRGKAGWTLSPAYDLNPVPVDIKARIAHSRLISTSTRPRAHSIFCSIRRTCLEFGLGRSEGDRA